jgi:hypothetical protein
MKKISKIITFLFIVVGCSFTFAQTLGGSPNIDHSLPKIESPSPSVAALMRFEEIPVSTYTGIPDISIPIYSIDSRSKDISVDIALKYHPSAIAVDEVASATGLGWSLFAGGSISRTVRGYPDEWYNPKSLGYGPAKVGIYRDDLGTTERNRYYEFMPIESTQITANQLVYYRKQIWESKEKGKFDNEHDLYQFNFMGHTGRFIIKKTSPTQYSVVRLDNDNAISVQYFAGSTSTPYFIVYDDKGYEFRFDIRETTKQWADSETIYLDNSVDQSLSSSSVDYVSSFHLSKIFRNNLLLVEFTYNTDSEIMNENTRSINNTINSNFSNSLSVFSIVTNCPGEISKFAPKSINSISRRNVKTKKIKKIDIVGKSKIYFTYENGRTDTNLSGDPVRLKKIEIKDGNDVAFKEFELYYSTSTVSTRKRMLLQKVTERAAGSTLALSYELTYAPNSGVNLNKDYWGYHTVDNPFYPKEPHPNACKTEVLQKMTLPTGGAVVFGFEANTYSYIGADAVTDFSDNFDYWLYDDDYKYFSSNGGPTNYQNLKVSTQNQLMKWTATFIGSNATVSLHKIVNGGYAPVPSVIGTEIVLEAGIQYAMKFTNFTIGSPASAAVVLNYREFNINHSQFKYGGGLRIKRIGHFEDASVSAQYYDIPNAGQPQPLKQKEYNYNFFTNQNKTSGSLSFGKPVFEYFKVAEAYLECTYMVNSYFYTTSTTFNNLFPLRTHGSDVGYQNVTVSETGNGTSRYTYRSPIDHPEDPDTYTFPDRFRPSKNKDYLRGQVTEEVHKNAAGDILKRIKYDYTTTESEELTGLTISGSSCPYSYLYQDYESYINPVNPGWNCGASSTYLSPIQLFEAFGWTRISSKITEEYFDVSTQPLTTSETFSFNPSNKKLETHIVTNSSNEVFKTNYTYLAGDIQQVDSYKDNILLSQSYIQYSNSWTTNNFKLPANIQTAKGGLNLETRLQYNRYDSVGNPEEIQQANGTKICYIWGYNNAYPVAKIENISYAAIPTALITAIQNASNAVNYNESAMLTALNNLRINTALAQAMVTTMTYKPLVGISSATDPKGDKITYLYDGLGRLEYVKDKDNNLLSENQYYYRTQN